jgi:hypothetical protein
VQNKREKNRMIVSKKINKQKKMSTGMYQIDPNIMDVQRIQH